MLINLHIVNLALIDELDIDFRDGLNVLTGETGAGKSIIIGSIGIGLGGRYDSSLLRTPDQDSLVELLFEVEPEIKKLLEKEDIEVPDGELLISRRLSGGRTVNRINDRNVTAKKLKEVAGALIGLHAQHEQRTLLSAAKHLDMVDAYSSVIPGLKKEVADDFVRFKEVKDRIDSMQLGSGERARRLDYIRYEINDIESARLVPGEDSELEAVFRKISASQDIVEITGEVEALVGYDNDRSAGSQVSRAVRAISGLTKLDPDSEELVTMLSDIDGLLSDFGRMLSDYSMSTEYDPETLRTTEERLNLINTLKARYGSDIEEILGSLERLRAEEQELSDFDSTLARLNKEKDDLERKLAVSCRKLSDERKKTAAKLTKAVADAMKDLNFNDVRLEMHFEEVPAGVNGSDRAEFYISTNVGEKLRPLVETASGGELSRIMLAIKSVVSEADDTPTLIFDEIDVGISGITAQKVGGMMKKIGEKRQVIAITHLPQIACLADSAYIIEKKVEEEKTFTSIRRLDEEGRVLEIARLLGGEDITESVLKTAREMIRK